MHRVNDRPRSAGHLRRYLSDATDVEWTLLEPLLPLPACQIPVGGRPEEHPRRDIVDAIRYLTDNGCKWRALPADFPPWKTVQGFFTRWKAAGGDQPYPRQSPRAGQDPCEPSSAAQCGIDRLAVDAAAETTGLLLVVMVPAANSQDRPAARQLLPLLHSAHPGLRLLWADGGYHGTLAEWAKTTLGITVEIVNKLAGQTSFVTLPRRWVVERTFPGSPEPAATPATTNASHNTPKPSSTGP